ncbi:MAG: amidohydrolase family protein [Planctomycetes bacterium]|nr:amidohydrolase family protein [Planctomycetota bacterium]
MLIIDCHAHIYGDDEKKYPTIDKPYRPPKGTGTLEHLRREMQAAGVRFVTAIQTSTFYRWDNRFTVDSARANPDWMVGVCTLDPDDPHSAGLLEEYVREYNVRGMRSIPAADGRLDHPGVVKLWETAERLGIVINVLVNRDKRDELSALLQRLPRLKVVLDHCLNIKAGPELDAIVADTVKLARHPNMHAKLTFIPTGSAEAYPCGDLHDACRAVIAAFGPDRCVWGSDFPCELWCPKVTYAQHLKIFTHELGLDAPTQAAILGKTAKGLWFARGR